MRKIGLLFLCVALYGSCVKEKTPGGLVLSEPKGIIDTTYVSSSVPAVQSRKILFEEATGVHCSNCPAGAAVLKSLKQSNPDKLLSVAVYSPFQNPFTPPKAKIDFNTKDAADLVAFLGGDPIKPSSAINRLETGNSSLPYFFDKNLWASTLTAQLTKTTPLNIELSSQKEGEGYKFKSTITFTDSITSPLAMSFYLLEDSIIDFQDDAGTDVLDYVHNHVLLDVITDIGGSAFLNTVIRKEKGRVFERRFTYTLPNNVVNKKHCKLLCFVHKAGASKEILHAEEIHLE